ncbi:hypothetical protein KUCAC02_032479 [Chaenocephalus aceratus]|nr:hypothetical protein KUCAC02_032479 [Chaenocephalus aceratus]
MSQLAQRHILHIEHTLSLRVMRDGLLTSAVCQEARYRCFFFRRATLLSLNPACCLITSEEEEPASYKEDRTVSIQAFNHPRRACGD